MLTALSLAIVSAMSLPKLTVSGEHLLDPAGKPVALKGCNLGNWMVLEFWMFGMPGIDPDQYTFEDTLAKRFGEAKKDAIMESYRSSWMTERDWEHIKSFGFNLVRLPMNYRTFEDDATPFKLKKDAWKWTDKAIAEAERHGMYVILDMHGIQGGQSVYDHTGRRDQNKVWTDRQAQDRAVWLWGELAKRYRNRSAVVAYDLFNEPYGGTKPQQVALFKMIYPAVRKADPEKLILAMGNYDDFTHYGSPKENGWTNVGYQMHYYPGLFGAGSPVLKTHVKHLEALAEVERKQNQWNAPFLIGEFNVVFDKAGGAAMMRRYYDRHAKYGWMSTMWSYKVVNSQSGGHGDASWGMVANAEPFKPIDPSKSSYEEMVAWAKSFASMPLSVNTPLRSMLVATNPTLPPLPASPPPLRVAPTPQVVPGWTGVDIAAKLHGSQVIQGEEIHLYGAGADIWGTSDEFRFLHQQVSGDFALSATLVSLLDTHGYAKAGLMVRASLDANAPYLMLSAFPEGGLEFSGRDAVGGTAVGKGNAEGWELGRKLRLRLTAGELIAEQGSASGAWSQVGRASWPHKTAYAGLVAMSHEPGQLTKASYRDLSLVVSK